MLILVLKTNGHKTPDELKAIKERITADLRGANVAVVVLNDDTELVAVEDAQ